MARDTRRRLVLMGVVMTLAGLVGVGSLPAAAHQPRTVQYVSLGDSYAAGQGAGSYVNGCLQSSYGYPALIDSMEHIHQRVDASCTGATTSDVINTQISALNRGTRLVTLTVGGNDLNVAGVASACTAGSPAQCQAAIDAALQLLAAPPGGSSELTRRLTATYRAVAAEAPKALILLTGYPYLFETPTADNPNAATILAINDATTTLNRTIMESVATAAQVDNINIRYVHVANGFAGHGIGSALPFINFAGPDAYHPNAAGYLAYAAAIRSVLTQESNA